MNTVAYACYNKNESNRIKSSSGGIYCLLAKKVINNGGCVFAAVYNEKLEVVHRKIDSKENLTASLGSKYVCSNLGDTFVQIQQLLKLNKEVMFVGTPCQCAGLLSFLKIEYEMLICIDFICHGVPSKVVWRKYLDSIQEKNSKILKINMRDKKTGWSNYTYCWNIKYSNDLEKFQPQQENPYMKGFVNDFYLRPSCYDCCFKGIERKTDFTLGDFWGVWDIYPDMDDNKGTSLVLLHTNKAKQCFEQIKHDITYKEVCIKTIIKYNKSIVESARLTPKRKIFYKHLPDKDFSKIIESLLKRSFYEQIKSVLVRLIKK